MKAHNQELILPHITAFLQTELFFKMFPVRRHDWLLPILLDLIKYGKLVISNGNRTKWSPIRFVIIRAIDKIGRPRSGSPIC